MKHEKHIRVVVSNYDCRLKRTNKQNPTISAAACSLNSTSGEMQWLVRTCKEQVPMACGGPHCPWPGGPGSLSSCLHHTVLLAHLWPGRYCTAFTCKSAFSNCLAKPNARLPATKLLSQLNEATKTALSTE